MRTTQRSLISVLITLLLMAGAVSVAEEIPVTLRVTGMDDYVGKPLFLRLVHEPSQVEIGRWSVPEISEAPWEVSLDSLRSEDAYRVDLFVDLNENGRYDAPPDDPAWRLALPTLEADEVVVLTPTDTFVDIRWAPRIDGVIEEEEYAHVLEDPQTGMTLYWSNDETVLHVGLVSPGTGWLSAGFAPQRRMLGANIIIAALVDGELQIEDHYGSSQTSHRQDEEENIVQSAGSLTETGTVLEFSLLLDSGDDQDAVLEPGTEVIVILAYHASRTDLRAGHTRRSTVEISLD